MDSALPLPERVIVVNAVLLCLAAGVLVILNETGQSSDADRNEDRSSNYD